MLDSEAINENFRSIIDDFLAMQKQINKISKDLSGLQNKVKKDLEKRKNKKKNKTSAFSKPTAISEELCKFMNLPKDTQKSRIEVTNFIIGYIKEKNLQNSDDKRIILPDKKLKNILSVSKEDKVTYFNLQSHLKRHFIKDVK